MEKKCIYCKKIFNYEKTQQFAAHVGSCKFNPNYNKKRKKISKSLKNNPKLFKRTVEKNDYVFNCQKCNNEYKLILSITEFNKGKYRKCCNISCSNSKSHSLETKKKISNTIIKKKLKFSKKINCKVCKKEIILNAKNKNKITCSSKCLYSTYEWKKMMSEISKKRCSTIKERKRMRDIGRKGGFGKKGYTKNGVYYQSTLEKKCFELLEDKKIKFEPHKPIPNSSKISDLYLKKYNLWIELDGIDREKKKKWIGKDYECWMEKIEIYKKQNLNLKIIKTFEEFLKELNKNFE